ncbi:MAG: glycerophosphodiester phosphodiesterase family protein [Paracoccaceae bacterium]
MITKCVLPPPFLARPLAHRGLHRRSEGRIENSLSAIDAAVQAGYGIEIDVQMSKDGQAIVFHDENLDRLTNETGPVVACDAAALTLFTLKDGQDQIATLPQVLRHIAGRCARLIEIKDQSGVLGPSDGRLETAIFHAISAYLGPLALMSFNPHSVFHMACLCPQIARGLTTEAFVAQDWPSLTAKRAEKLCQISDYEASGSSFISHDWRDLGRPRVAALRAASADILCWTVRSRAEEAKARKNAQNVTFENYLPGPKA